MTITTDYYMEPRGEFSGIETPSLPMLALKAVYKKTRVTTVLPFEIVDFNTPSFTYTLLAPEYEASPLLISKGSFETGATCEDSLLGCRMTEDE